MSATLRKLVIAAALLPGANCLADDVTVTANGNFTFSPSTVTINAGDTVTFRNGGGFHNVAADDGSFRCADGCGSSGGASSSNWQFTHTFDEPGSYGYHCEVHGQPGSGMYGTVIVRAGSGTAPIPLGGYMSGGWYDPASSGQGFLMDFTSTSSTLVAIWFTFAPDGSGPYWIYAQGPYDNTKSTVTIPAILLTGTAFPPNFDKDDVVKTPWGTMTFSFSSCSAGQVSWTSTLPGYGSGSMPLTRLWKIAGTQCPVQ